MPVSTALQGKNVDLALAIDMIQNLRKILEQMRENAQTDFAQHFSLAKEFANEMGEEISLPRIVGRQSHRANYAAQTPEDYYRFSVYIPFIEHFISQLDDRFLKHKNILIKIENMLPCKITSLNNDELAKTISIIMSQWPDIVNIPENVFKSEVLLWQLKWASADEKPKYFIDALNYCNEQLFPNVFKILKVCATIPVTTASAERSFSTLKRIKTYLRNTMGENRLNGLTALSIHREIKVNIEEIIDRFESAKKRRIDLA